MDGTQKGIVVYVFYQDQKYQVDTHPNAYRNLMQLIEDNIFIDGFGECLGMGKCGTCLVDIISKKQEPSGYERNEDTTLLKAGYSGENMRLSCQLMIDEMIDGLEVKVLL